MTLESPIIGRTTERERVLACLKVGRNVLLEGPVGVGKTALALDVVRELGLESLRVDGDNRYTEQRLTGWFDPPEVLRHGYTETAFVAGPLVQAMRSGGILFLNELNRFPEGVQNVLLPAIDERRISLPRLGVVEAAPGFRVIATQNPKEFVATSHLSEAILDRFELVVLGYQSEAEERKIVTARVQALFPKADQGICDRAVEIVRKTRGHAKVRRGASVRAAIAVAEIAHSLLERGTVRSAAEAVREAVVLALPGRVEIERDMTGDGTDPMAALLDELVGSEKKKN